MRARHANFNQKARLFWRTGHGKHVGSFSTRQLNAIETPAAGCGLLGNEKVHHPCHGNGTYSKCYLDFLHLTYNA